MNTHRVTSMISIFSGLAFLCANAALADDSPGVDPRTTSTQWRDDKTNLEIVRKLNQAYGRVPFSQDYEGMLNERPFEISWSVGPNLPVTWKGGVAGLIDGQIVIAGGMWMPARENLTYVYDLKTKTYEKLPSPPVRPQYTQGTCDGRAIYIVGGRGSGRRVLKLARDEKREWKWSDLAPLPQEEGNGRWLGTVSLVSGKWLIVVAGTPTGAPSEKGVKPQLPDYCLNLEQPQAEWERIATYPGGPRSVLQSTAVGDKMYVFGGSNNDPVMRSLYVELITKYGIRVPYNGVPNYRDAYRYDPEADRWETLRRLPFPVIAGSAVPVDDNHILLMGSADTPTYRVGKSKRNPGVEIKDGDLTSRWRGYGDRIVCYDIDRDNYSHVGVMPYGVATVPWIFDGARLYAFGGEPSHGFNMNTENVLQIGTLNRTDGTKTD